MEHSCPSSANFLTLPREIRDRIYGFSLVTDPGITVWYGGWRCLLPPSDKTVPRYNPNDYIREVDHEATASVLRSLTLNLLHCGNSTVAAEAACTFYSQNTFAFVGQHNWDPIIPWLEGIGARNRSLLMKIDIADISPERVYQMEDGSRHRFAGVEEIYPRNAHLSTTSLDEFPVGEVANINPNTETVFDLLGRSREGAERPLRIQLYLPEDVLPEVECADEENVRHGLRTFSKDLLRLIEKFCAPYVRRNQSEGAGCLQVEWVLRVFYSSFHEKKAAIESRGWEVVDTKMIDHDRLPEGRSNDERFWRMAVKLKREIDVPQILEAADPVSSNDCVVM